jgi:hypothetical protein
VRTYKCCKQEDVICAEGFGYSPAYVYAEGDVYVGGYDAEC